MAQYGTQWTEEDDKALNSAVDQLNVLADVQANLVTELQSRETVNGKLIDISSIFLQKYSELAGIVRGWERERQDSACRIEVVSHGILDEIGIPAGSALWSIKDWLAELMRHPKFKQVSQRYRITTDGFRYRVERWVQANKNVQGDWYWTGTVSDSQDLVSVQMFEAIATDLEGIDVSPQWKEIDILPPLKAGDSGIKQH